MEVTEVDIEDVYVAWKCDCGTHNMDAVDGAFGETVECEDDECDNRYEMIPDQDSVHVEVVGI